MFFKIGVLKNFTNSQESTCVFVSLFVIKACNFVKKRVPQVLPCEIREIFKNTFFFTENLFTVPVSVCSENLGKILVRKINKSHVGRHNFTKNFTADVLVGIFRNNIHS